MELAVHPNELILFYNSSSIRGRKTLAFAQSICKNINKKDFDKTKITRTLWRELLKMLNKEPKELLNKSDPEYQGKIKGHEYNMEGWLNILAHSPHLIKAPIAIKNKQAILCEKPKDVLRLDDDCN